MSSWNAVTPADGNYNFWGWLKRIDAEHVTTFLNQLSEKYGNFGYDNRGYVTGSSGGASFVFTFLTKGGVGDLANRPLIYISYDTNVQGNAVHKSSSFPLPDREEGEDFTELTERWISSAYQALYNFDQTSGKHLALEERIPFFKIKILSTTPEPTPISPSLLPLPLASFTSLEIPLTSTPWPSSQKTSTGEPKYVFVSSGNYPYQFTQENGRELPLGNLSEGESFSGTPPLINNIPAAGYSMAMSFRITEDSFLNSFPLTLFGKPDSFVEDNNLKLESTALVTFLGEEIPLPENFLVSEEVYSVYLSASTLGTSFIYLTGNRQTIHQELPASVRLLPEHLSIHRQKLVLRSLYFYTSYLSKNKALLAMQNLK